MNWKVNLGKLWRRAHKFYFIDQRDKDALKSFKTLEEIITTLESTAKEYFGVKYALIVPSGRAGIELVMRSLELDKKTSLLTQAYQCYDVARIVNEVSRISYADLEQNQFNASPSSFAKAITPQTKVIMPVNLYGFPSDNLQIASLCKKHNLFFLEDGAHALGASSSRKKVGTFGDAAVFSFSKTLASPAGGLFITNNSSLYEKAKSILPVLEIKRRNRIANFLQKRVITSMTTFRSSQRFFPTVLLLEKMHQYFRSAKKEEAYRVSLSHAELSLCLSQFKKLDEMNAHYVDQYKKFSVLMKDVPGIKLFPYKAGSTALRFPLLFNKPLNIGLALSQLYKKGAFEPSLNYHEEYDNAAELVQSSLPHSDDLKDRLLILSLDHLSKDDLKELKQTIVSISSSS